MVMTAGCLLLPPLSLLFQPSPVLLWQKAFCKIHLIFFFFFFSELLLLFLCVGGREQCAGENFCARAAICKRFYRFAYLFLLGANVLLMWLGAIPEHKRSFYV